MDGLIGLIAFILIGALVLSIVIARARRSRYSVQLQHVLRSGLIESKQLRPACKNELLRLEQALTYKLLKKFGGTTPDQQLQIQQAEWIRDLEGRVEEGEQRCGQLMQQNMELSQALSKAEQFLQHMQGIADNAIKSAGLSHMNQPDEQCWSSPPQDNRVDETRASSPQRTKNDSNVAVRG